ncbi:Lrp/AsnC family transcriptional regulator [Sinomonas halotolerans]|uniref:Lrp/AsnC family transcriptional regulator n=1 Tax=Sinomonas halotolerans TaxID=1644133 RepID=A0ABU9WXQ8_9MICC
MELPVEDLELVHALQIAPRATWTELGAILSRHPTTLAARWDRLSAEGKVWVTGHLGTGRSQGCIAFISLECAPGRRAKVIARLCAAPVIGTVEESARAWDVRLTVIAVDWGQVLREVLPILRNDPEILRLQVTVATRLYATGAWWRLDVLTPAKQRRLAALAPAVSRIPSGLPPHARKMMAVVARNGRASAVEIAEATGTHPTTAARHLRHAVETGLLAFRCELAQSFSGYPVACQWYVRVPPAQLDAAVGYLRTYRTLRLCASTTGDTNLTFYLWLRTPEDIADVEEGLQGAAPGAQVIESNVGVREHKRMGWMLNEDTTATGVVVVDDGGAASGA